MSVIDDLFESGLHLCYSINLMHLTRSPQRNMLKVSSFCEASEKERKKEIRSQMRVLKMVFLSEKEHGTSPLNNLTNQDKRYLAQINILLKKAITKFFSLAKCFQLLPEINQVMEIKSNTRTTKLKTKNKDRKTKNKQTASLLQEYLLF